MTNIPCLYVAYLSDSFKHNGVVGLCKIQIPLETFKALCHALSGAFILIQLYWFGLKCLTLIHACNLSSLPAVA